MNENECRSIDDLVEFHKSVTKYNMSVYEYIACNDLFVVKAILELEDNKTSVHDLGLINAINCEDYHAYNDEYRTAAKDILQFYKNRKES